MSLATAFEFEDELELEVLHFNEEFETTSPARRRPLTMQELKKLVDPWRRRIAPEIPMEVLAAYIDTESARQVCNATHGAAEPIRKNGKLVRRTFYELGLFQTPAGQYRRDMPSGQYRCLNEKGHWETPDACAKRTPCEIQPPGLEDPSDHSQWYKICARLKLDHKDWTNPAIQVQVGLTDLKTTADGIARGRHGFPELFQRPGSEWYLRMAVFLPFAKGAGYTRKFLQHFRSALAGRPESERWTFLKNIKGFDPGNVEEYMRRARKLGYAPAP
jgi:hypothetical protein